MIEFDEEQPRKQFETLVPLINVVFLLLIFFMVSTTFDDKTQLSITLPEADGAPQAQVDDQVEVTITSTGDYLVTISLIHI